MEVVNAYQRGRSYVIEKPFELVIAIASIALLGDLILKVASGSLPIFDLSIYIKEGIVLGLIIGLAGVGLSMTYSILNFANFAHGDYLTSGAFAGWVATYLIAGFGTLSTADLFLIGVRGDANAVAVNASVASTPIAIFAGLLFAIIFTLLLSLVIDKFVYEPMRGESGITLLFASIGVALALRYIIAFIWGQETSALTPNGEPTFSIPVAELPINTHEITLIVCALGFMLGVHYLLQYTKLGKAMRAMSDNRDLAAITGIPIERVIRATWAIGGGLTGAAGYLIALEGGLLAFNTGWNLLLLIFAGVILGGIGSIYGAIFGGLAIGVISNVSTVWLPSDLTTAAPFAAMILILIIKPTGLFRGVTTA